MNSFHFLRPYWLISFLPLLGLIIYLIKKPAKLQHWKQICDEHLLPYLLIKSDNSRAPFFIFPLLSLGFMILSLAGPAFVKLPQPVYQHQQANVLVLDLSQTMLAQDIKPNRLQRAKFKLRDLLRQTQHGQVGLIVYAGEPYIVSPLTDDGYTIDSLMDVLSPDILPVGGNRLDMALQEAYKLIKQSGYTQGNVLVLTAETPSPQAIETAEQLAKGNLLVSILPILARDQINSIFKSFARAGHGQVYPFTESSQDILSWLTTNAHSNTFKQNNDDSIPLWRDDGRWFLIPALLFLLPLFRRGQRERLVS